MPSNKNKKNQQKFRSMGTCKFDEEMKKIDQTVAQMIVEKSKEMKFAVKETLTVFPEVEELNKIIDKAVDSFRLQKAVGQYQYKEKESKTIKEKITELKFAREHLVIIMNMDFDRP